MLVAEPVTGQDPKGGAEQGALGLVTDVAVLDLPRNQRGAAFGQIQDPLLGVIPWLGAVGLLEHAERGSLGVAKTLHGGRILVPVPTPGRALDAGGRQDAGRRPQALRAF